MKRRYKPRRKVHTRGNIKIKGGLSLPIILAKQICRCAICLGPVVDHNNGLGCKADPEGHHGLIHQREAKAEAKLRQAELDQVKKDYTVQDDQLVAFSDHTEGGPDAD